MPDWEKHYLDRDVEDQTPASVLTENLHLLPESGTVLDYACGLAANGCLLAHKGYQVTVVDNSNVAINKIKSYSDQFSLNIKTEVHDLENKPLADVQYDIVIVSFFLHRETIRSLPDLVKPGGLLFYQTFSGDQLNGRGPSNPNFRLKHGELLEVFSNMNILFYREDQTYGNLQDGIRDQAQIVVAKT